MRERHFPRLCTACKAPMARQQDACWACGTPWPPLVAARASVTRRAPAEPDATRIEASDRWTNEGGGLRPEPAYH